MTPLQWKIVEHAYYHQADLFGLVPKIIRELYIAGPAGDVGAHDLMLNGLGKRFGLIPWESQREKDSDRRMLWSLRSNRRKRKGKASTTTADYSGAGGRR